MDSTTYNEESALQRWRSLNIEQLQNAAKQLDLPWDLPKEELVQSIVKLERSMENDVDDDADDYDLSIDSDSEYDDFGMETDMPLLDAGVINIKEEPLQDRVFSPIGIKEEVKSPTPEDKVAATAPLADDSSQALETPLEASNSSEVAKKACTETSDKNPNVQSSAETSKKNKTPSKTQMPSKASRNAAVMSILSGKGARTKGPEINRAQQDSSSFESRNAESSMNCETIETETTQSVEVTAGSPENDVPASTSVSSNLPSATARDVPVTGKPETVEAVKQNAPARIPPSLLPDKEEAFRVCRQAVHDSRLSLKLSAVTTLALPVVQTAMQRASYFKIAFDADTQGSLLLHFPTAAICESTRALLLAELPGTQGHLYETYRTAFKQVKKMPKYDNYYDCEELDCDSDNTYYHDLAQRLVLASPVPDDVSDEALVRHVSGAFVATQVVLSSQQPGARATAPLGKSLEATIQDNLHVLLLCSSRFQLLEALAAGRTREIQGHQVNLYDLWKEKPDTEEDQKLEKEYFYQKIQLGTLGIVPNMKVREMLVDFLVEKRHRRELFKRQKRIAINNAIKCHAMEQRLEVVLDAHTDKLLALGTIPPEKERCQMTTQYQRMGGYYPGQLWKPDNPRGDDSDIDAENCNDGGSEGERPRDGVRKRRRGIPKPPRDQRHRALIGRGGRGAVGGVYRHGGPLGRGGGGVGGGGYLPFAGYQKQTSASPARVYGPGGGEPYQNFLRRHSGGGGGRGDVVMRGQEQRYVEYH